MGIAAELGYAPLTPRDAAKHLVEESLVTEEEYQCIRRIVSFQNIIVHESADMNVIKRIIRE
jgi:uncharacterized protein YutE (UPF0331/DUF86 family)